MSSERDPRLEMMEALARRNGGGCWHTTWAPTPMWVGGVMVRCARRRGHDGPCRPLLHKFEWTPDPSGRGPLEPDYKEP